MSKYWFDKLYNLILARGKESGCILRQSYDGDWTDTYYDVGDRQYIIGETPDVVLYIQRGGTYRRFWAQ